jgi:hypothetical protein
MLTRLKVWLAHWAIRRYLKRFKLSESTLSPNQQIDALQRQIAALKAMQSATPSVSLADQLAAIPKPTLVTPSLVEQIAANGAAVPVPPAVQPAMAVPVVEPPPAPVPAQPAPVELPPELPAPLPEPVMETPAQPAATLETPKSTGSALPDVKMLAPILKIALAVLTIEQMVEIGLHVKMGAPGFQQFLDSDVAKTKFRELYATYCEFLAGKVK